MDGMRRIHKALIALLLLVVAFALTLEVLNRTVLPQKLRDWAQKTATEAVGRPVTIGAVRLHILRGFVLEKISVAEDPRYGTEPFLEAEQLSGGLLVVPLLQKKEFLIPSLHLVKPTIRLLQDDQGGWNVQTLSLAKPKAPEAAPGAYRLSLPKAVVTGGTVIVRPNLQSGLPALRLEHLETDVHLSLPAQVQATASAELFAGLITAQSLGKLTLDARYLLQERRFTAESQSDWTLPPVFDLLPKNLRSQLDQLEGSLSLKLQAAGQPQGPLELTGTARTGGLKWARSPYSGAGDLSAQFQSKAGRLDGITLLQSLKGTLRLEGLTAGPAPYVGPLRDIAGEFQFDLTGVRSENLELRLANGTQVKLSGALSNDENRSFGLRAVCDLQAEDLPPLPESLQKTLSELNLSGKIGVEAVANGSLQPQFTLRPTVVARISQLVSAPAKGPRVEVASGQVRWQPELITFMDVQGRTLEQPFKLEGTLANWAQPEVNATFTWGKLAGDLQAAMTSEKINIESLTGRLGKGNFRLFGEIDRPQPQANLFSEGTIELADAAELWPPLKETIETQKLSGTVSGRCLLQGLLTKPDKWDLDLNASSPSLVARGVPFQDLSLRLRQQQGRATLESAHARLAGGTVSLSGSADLAGTPARWDGQLKADGVNLAELARILNWSAREISGQLALEWAGAGETGKPETAEGAGTVRVAGAQILELPLMGNFADFLKLPTLRSIRFHEAQGPFRIRQGRMETDSLVLASTQATLTISGWGGFLKGPESPIEWKVLPTLGPELLPEESRSKLGRVIAQGASYFVGEVYVTGTWAKPQHKIVSKKPVQILNEQIMNLGEVLEGIF